MDVMEKLQVSLKRLEDENIKVSFYVFVSEVVHVARGGPMIEICGG